MGKGEFQAQEAREKRRFIASLIIGHIPKDMETRERGVEEDSILNDGTGEREISIQRMVKSVAFPYALFFQSRGDVGALPWIKKMDACPWSSDFSSSVRSSKYPPGAKP